MFPGSVEVLHWLWDWAGGVWKHQKSLQEAAAAHSARQGENRFPELRLDVKVSVFSSSSSSSFLVQVWISYAKFELSIDGPDRLQKCRQIFEEANKGMRNCEEKEERLMLLESWRDFEKEFGSESTMDRVQKLLPEKVKKRRKLTAEDGVRTQSLSRNNLHQSILITGGSRFTRVLKIKCDIIRHQPTLLPSTLSAHQSLNSNLLLQYIDVKLQLSNKYLSD